MGTVTTMVKEIQKNIRYFHAEKDTENRHIEVDFELDFDKRILRISYPQSNCTIPTYYIKEKGTFLNAVLSMSKHDLICRLCDTDKTFSAVKSIKATRKALKKHISDNPPARVQEIYERTEEEIKNIAFHANRAYFRQNARQAIMHYNISVSNARHPEYRVPWREVLQMRYDIPEIVETIAELFTQLQDFLRNEETIAKLEAENEEMTVLDEITEEFKEKRAYDQTDECSFAQKLFISKMQQIVDEENPEDFERDGEYMDYMLDTVESILVQCQYGEALDTDDLKKAETDLDKRGLGARKHWLD